MIFTYAVETHKMDTVTAIVNIILLTTIFTDHLGYQTCIGGHHGNGLACIHGLGGCCICCVCVIIIPSRGFIGPMLTTTIAILITALRLKPYIAFFAVVCIESSAILPLVALVTDAFHRELPRGHLGPLHGIHLLTSWMFSNQTGATGGCCTRTVFAISYLPYGP